MGIGMEDMTGEVRPVVWGQTTPEGEVVWEVVVFLGRVGAGAAGTLKRRSSVEAAAGLPVRITVQQHEKRPTKVKSSTHKPKRA